MITVLCFMNGMYNSIVVYCCKSFGSMVMVIYELCTKLAVMEVIVMDIGRRQESTTNVVCGEATNS